ncbi:MAG: glucose 1-dehydrogenase [Spirochaetaceae bacterium]|jgi:NAD(P)-dependent dehydrogenase (short-subunit alcohol dehydrogenase family)|nr:glucose 1-dehydrogenase [Spirochaetaceae bacterium]GMO24478.1 MAG: glucose 1-dehydrogenase [Termitinemataceae bacterium]
MKVRLAGKAALVTGGAQGLGAAISCLFAENGAVVFIADMQADVGAATVSEITEKGGKAYFVSLDVSKEESWIEARAFMEKNAGRADILVNNAGINIREPIEEMKAENFDKMLAVNVRGPFLGIKHFIPLLRKSGGGSIINMSSVCGLIGHRYTTEAYTVTKGALTLLTKTIAVRYAKDNIRCNSIHPSTVNTPLVQELFKNPDRKAERLGEVPLGRLATAEDVAAAALFLASDEAAFLNGVALPVDGGTTAD